MPDFDTLQQRRTELLVKEIQKTLLEQLEDEQRTQQAQQQAQQQGQQQEQQAPPVVQQMNVDADIEGAAPVQAAPANQMSRKKREELENARQKAADQRGIVRSKEHSLLMQRVEMSQQATMTPEQIKAETALLEAKIKASKLAEQARLLEVGNDKRERKRVLWEAQAERAKAVGDYAQLLPLGSKERAKAMDAKEQQELKADHLHREYKISLIENKQERDREKNTLLRHDGYDALKKLFRKDNPLSHVDAEWVPEGTNCRLVNVGRAYFGGTKPMYIFEDRNNAIGRRDGVTIYKQYLFKEAINCIGRAKPMGAMVTEAASRLQQKICGEDSIPAFAAISEDGQIFGSFQEKVDSIHGEGAVDLFSWQANPQDNLPAEVKRQILREHVLDWLLCNFDTKGENFLTKLDGHLCSFDKEASFSRLGKDKAADHMSTDYKPHANQTLYNTVFTEFVNGRLDLDLSDTQEYINIVEAMTKEEYMGLFNNMLTKKYGDAEPGNTSRAKAEAAIWARKAGLREEYRRFYGDLLLRRQAAMHGPGQNNGFVDEEHPFRFANEGQILLLSKGIHDMNDVLVQDIPREELIDQGATTYNLTLPEGEAQRMKEASNGFLTYRKGEDGSCTMRPSMPETVVFDGKEIAFRKNYKLLTALIARAAITTDDRPLTEASLNARLDAFASLLRNLEAADNEELSKVFLPILLQNLSLCGDQSPESVLYELCKFLKASRGYYPAGESKGAKLSKTFILTKESIEPFYQMLALTSILSKGEDAVKALIQEARTKDPSITNDMVDTMLKEDLPLFRQDLAQTIEAVTRCANQDLDSDEVFLPGACSANALLMTCVNNPSEHGVLKKNPEAMHGRIFRHHASDLAEEIPEQMEERMRSLTGQEFRLSTDPAVRAEQLKTLARHCSYDYHVGGYAGEIDGMEIALEAFAAEGYQLLAPGFTDQVGIGLYQGQEAFKRFYARNADAIFTEEQLRRSKLKGILREAADKL